MFTNLTCILAKLNVYTLLTIHVNLYEYLLCSYFRFILYARIYLKADVYAR